MKKPQWKKFVILFYFYLIVIDSRNEAINRIEQKLESITLSKIKILEIYNNLELKNSNISYELIKDPQNQFGTEIFSKIKKILIHLRKDQKLMYDILMLSSYEECLKLSFFITQNFYENILSPKSLEDECLILITKIYISKFQFLLGIFL